MATYRVPLANQIDPYTDSVMTIDRLITMIFLGNMYNVSSYFNLNSTGTMEFLIKTPSDESAGHHVWFTVQGSSNFNAQIFEDTTKVANTSNALTAHNRNRTSSNTCQLVITHTPTGSGDGTLLYSNQWGGPAGPGASSLGEGGATSEAHQWVLKPNTKYLVRVTSTTDSNYLGVSANIVSFTSENNKYITKAFSNINL